MRKAFNRKKTESHPEAPTVPQSAFVSVLGSGIYQSYINEGEQQIPNKTQGTSLKMRPY